MITAKCMCGIFVAGLLSVVCGQARASGGQSAEAKGPACMSCHSDTAEGQPIRIAEAQYRESGHWLGLRRQTATGSAEAFEHEGTAAFTASSDISKKMFHLDNAGCQGCHTEQGFHERIAKGNATDLATVAHPLRIECFTCHQPHTNGNFSLIAKSTDPVPTLSAVGGVIGRTFDGGKGNLCAMCHRFAGPEPDMFHTFWNGKGKNETATVFLPNFGHRPQNAEFLMGQGEWPFDSNYDGTGTPLTYATANPHYTTVKDTCVGCHMGSNGAPASSLAGHTFYLSNYRTDVTAGCTGCHGAEAFRPAGMMEMFGGIRFRNAKIAKEAALVDYDGNGVADQLLIEIEGMRNTLLVYFSTPANFPGQPKDAPPAPVINLKHPELPGAQRAQPLSTEFNFNGDYRFADAMMTLTRAQAESFYDLRIVVEDRSFGIHNPRFAAQLLYDSIKNLNVNSAAGLKVGTERP